MRVSKHRRTLKYSQRNNELNVCLCICRLATNMLFQWYLSVEGVGHMMHHMMIECLLNFKIERFTASLEGHFDAPSFPLGGSQEKQAAIPTQDLKTGPTVVLDFGAHMNEIIEVHERDLDVVVQPGMPYEQLNEELVANKLFFPVDVSVVYDTVTFRRLC